MATKRDYYEILGVPKTATPDEIKKSHRKLVRKFHPDVNKDAGASDKFKEVQEAYDILSDPEKRKRYDQFGHAGDRRNIRQRRQQADVIADVPILGQGDAETLGARQPDRLDRLADEGNLGFERRDRHALLAKNRRQHLVGGILAVDQNPVTVEQDEIGRGHRRTTPASASTPG